MKKRIIIISGITAVIAAIFAVGVFIIRKNAYSVEPLTVEMIAAADTKNADKLMIVAHPDDEVIWGGGHLMDGGYFVVCITNGKNDTRSEEFRQVIEASGNSGMILDYPDKVLFLRDDWSRVRGGICADIELVMKYKKWDMVVTHNPSGEYGHQHHKLTNGYVSEISRDTGTEMWCFGKYYKKSDLDNVKPRLTAITPEQLKFKEKLEELYKSQSGTVKKLSHMNGFEMWNKYDY